mmetsp:Transcript_10241/g.18047  ORF Transcript_10241/g.18047 Transcript_10241/m.18047 type:complete len:218 (-) Transcript_10241:28-681(-)
MCRFPLLCCCCFWFSTEKQRERLRRSQLLQKSQVFGKREGLAFQLGACSDKDLFWLNHTNTFDGHDVMACVALERHNAAPARLADALAAHCAVARPCSDKVSRVLDVKHVFGARAFDGFSLVFCEFLVHLDAGHQAVRGGSHGGELCMFFSLAPAQLHSEPDLLSGNKFCKHDVVMQRAWSGHAPSKELLKFLLVLFSELKVATFDNPVTFRQAFVV